LEKNSGPVWLCGSNTHFHILKNFTHILTHFFTQTYIKNTQKNIIQTPLLNGPFCNSTSASTFFHPTFPSKLQGLILSNICKELIHVPGSVTFFGLQDGEKEGILREKEVYRRDLR